MIRKELKLAFKIDVKHTYFENGISKDFWFALGSATKKLKQKFDLALFPRAGGLDFYINSATELATFYAYLTQTASQPFFDFELKTSRSDFYNFTAFPSSFVGLLTFESNNTLNETITDGVLLSVVLKAETIQDQTVGVVKIHFEDLLNNDKFMIRLESKVSQWQYFIINQSNMLFDELSIKGKSDIDFTKPETVVLDSGETAILFTTGNQLIPLNEKPKYKFELLNKSSAKNQTIFKALPNPDPNRFGRVIVDNENQFSSPMYVYV